MTGNSDNEEKITQIDGTKIIYKTVPPEGPVT